MLTGKIRRSIAVLGAALTVTISTAAIAPSAYASKNVGCNAACKTAIGKQVVIGTACDNLQWEYNQQLRDIGDWSLVGEYSQSVNAAFNATKLYNAAKDDGCAGPRDRSGLPSKPVGSIQACCYGSMKHLQRFRSPASRLGSVRSIRSGMNHPKIRAARRVSAGGQTRSAGPGTS